MTLDEIVKHKFWSTQPVTQLPATSSAGKIAPDDSSIVEGVIQPVVPSEVRGTPYTLPAGFEWCEVDVENEGEMRQVYELLTKNYVEDDDAMFRFDYSAQFLRW